MTQNTSLSRRSLLAISAAAVAGTAAVAAPVALAHAATPSPDAELLTMVEEWIVGEKHMAQLYDAQDEAEDRYRATRPDFPQACIRQPGDPALQLCIPSRVGERYEEKLIEERRGKIRKQVFAHPITDEIRAQYGYPEDAHTIHRLEPWPEAQARSEEIISAWDRYNADDDRVKQESGLLAADRVVKEAIARIHSLEDRIARMRAKTPAGIIAKAKMAALDPMNADGFEADLEDALEARESTAAFIGHSLILDILHMNGGQA